MKFPKSGPSPCLALLILAAWFGSASWLVARDVFVMLSGGVSPVDNNHSQFLQARAVVQEAARRFAPDARWTFFGAGNVEGSKPIFNDVRVEELIDGIPVNHWIPGALPGNRPARRDIFLNALREEILPAVAEGGTLFLFVGDHGSPGEGDGGTEIDLWSLRPDASHERGWRTVRQSALSVADLRKALSAGIGRGKVVFCMTQCYSGGFHDLGLPARIVPNKQWFTLLPAWAGPDELRERPLRAAGFTATDDGSPAAGCDPSPDPSGWEGYERFLPEQLFGLDLFTLQRTGKPKNSFAEAHRAATTLDWTIDKPFSTSERYLVAWAKLIEEKFVRAPELTSEANRYVTVFQRSLNEGPRKVKDRALRVRQELYTNRIKAIHRQQPAYRATLTGSFRDLARSAGESIRGGALTPGDALSSSPDDEVGRPETPRRGRRGGGRQARTLWREQLRPAWEAALKSGKITDLDGPPLAFEQSLLKKETEGADFFSFMAGDQLLEEAFWFSGYGNVQSVDREKAESVLQWAAVRPDYIINWALEYTEESLRVTGEKVRDARLRQMEALGFDPEEPEPKSRGISLETAASRVLACRRVLAAWEFLLNAKEEPALQTLRDLVALEETPLPAPRR